MIAAQIIRAADSAQSQVAHAIGAWNVAFDRKPWWGQQALDERKERLPWWLGAGACGYSRARRGGDGFGHSNY